MFQGINVKSHVSYFPACWHEQMYWSDRKQTSLPTEAWGKKASLSKLWLQNDGGQNIQCIFSVSTWSSCCALPASLFQSGKCGGRSKPRKQSHVLATGLERRSTGSHKNRGCQPYNRDGRWISNDWNHTVCSGYWYPILAYWEAS